MNSKMNIKNHNLLFFVFCLLIIKFVIYPIIDWQNEQWTDIKLKQKQLVKSQQLIATKYDIDNSIIKLDNQLAELNKSLPIVNIDNFKMETQKAIGALLLKHSIKVERTAWIIAPDPGEIHEVTIQLSLSGRMSDLLKSHIAIEKEYPGAKVTRLRTNINRHLAKSMGTFTGRIRLAFLVRSNQGVTNV